MILFEKKIEGEWSEQITACFCNLWIYEYCDRQDVPGSLLLRVKVTNPFLQWHKEGHFHGSWGAPGFAAWGCHWSSRAVLGLLHKASMEKPEPVGEPWGRIMHSLPSFLSLNKNSPPVAKKLSLAQAEVPPPAARADWPPGLSWAKQLWILLQRKEGKPDLH